jgi:hypothetical protein
MDDHASDHTSRPSTPVLAQRMHDDHEWIVLRALDATGTVVSVDEGQALTTEAIGYLGMIAQTVAQDCGRPMAIVMVGTPEISIGSSSPAPSSGAWRAPNWGCSHPNMPTSPLVESGPTPGFGSLRSIRSCLGQL